MKIVYVTSESYFDHSYTIVKELRKTAELVVYLQVKNETPEINEWCRKLDACLIKRKRFRNPLGLIDDIWLLLRIEKNNPDVVWFNTFTFYQALIAKLFIKKYFVNMHDVEFHPESKDLFSKLSYRITMLLHKKNIAVVSRVQAELFEKKTSITPKIFQLPVIDYYKDVGEEMSSNKNDVVKFFFFGSIEPYKGIEKLLDAADILYKENIICEINIFGKPKYSHETFFRRINSNPLINHVNHFIDYKHVHELYCMNDVLVLPYKQVTQCGPLLIGFSEGVPAVCNNLPGFKEYIDENNSGWFFENTSESLAEKMKEIILKKESLSEMRNYIMNQTYLRFSMQNLSEQYLKNLCG